MGNRFAGDRHMPEGQWVQTTMAIPVMGATHHKAAWLAFVGAARKAEKGRLLYGVTLEAEPTNAVDPNAIIVHGYAERQPWFGSLRREQWMLGYLDAETAAEMAWLTSRGLALAAQLYSIYRNGDFIDIKIIVLAPPGHGMKARLKAMAKEQPR